MNLGTQDVGLAISAAGTTQATATELINGLNQITTAASGSGVVLFASTSGGTFQLVYNGGANPVKVYPPLGAQINSLPVNQPLILAVNTTCEFWFMTSTSIVGLLSA